VEKRSIKLEHPDDLHLEAAQGWLELGDHLEANEELERISPDMRVHPDVLNVRWHIYSKAQKWDTCVDIASALIDFAPECSLGWIHRSFSLHNLKRTQEAFDRLLPVANEFPRVWNIPYNLACYCAQLGRLDEAQDWFKKAMAIDEQSVKESALDDPDLKPLWDSMSGILWKRGE
jgi:tetratricopeptide (TPR) repeat protein